jgi:anti-sigma regulatory factor (Ser/Thr protein kinase)
MSQVGESPAAPATFVHQALIYESEQQFVDTALPFVEAGVEAGEPVLVAVQERNIEALRRRLPGDSPGVELRTVEQWYENPSRTRAKFAAWVAEHRNGHRVRLIGEPPWPLSSEARIREWARHESVLNVAFEGLPLTFICPYDARILPDSIIGHARRTHPDVCNRREVARSDVYAEPRDYCRQLNGEGRAREGAPAIETDFAPGDLSLIRELVASEGRRVEMDRERIEDLVLAVNEVATNALQHGVAPVSIRVWRGSEEIVFDVRDHGQGVADPLAGQLRPDPELGRGWGLWIARMVADAVEIRSSAGESAVSVHAAVIASP